MDNSLEQLRAIYYSLPLDKKRRLVEILKAQSQPDQEKSGQTVKRLPVKPRQQSP